MVRRAAQIAIAIGAAGSLAFLVRAGERTPPFLLFVMASWVLAPFVMLAIAVSVSQRWPRLVRTTLYTAAISVTDGAANTATTNRTVNVGSAPPAAGPSSGPAPLPPVTGLPDPVLGKTANVLPLKPVVRIKVPRAKKFVALTRALR